MKLIFILLLILLPTLCVAQSSESEADYAATQIAKAQQKAGDNYGKALSLKDLLFLQNEKDFAKSAMFLENLGFIYSLVDSDPEKGLRL